jgi:hypothetical protein
MKFIHLLFLILFLNIKPAEEAHTQYIKALNYYKNYFFISPDLSKAKKLFKLVIENPNTWPIDREHAAFYYNEILEHENEAYMQYIWALKYYKYYCLIPPDLSKAKKLFTLVIRNPKVSAKVKKDAIAYYNEIVAQENKEKEKDFRERQKRQEEELEKKRKYREGKESEALDKQLQLWGEEEMAYTMGYVFAATFR